MDIIFNCPHCDDMIIVNTNDLNCKIFRHAYYKKSFKQIDPHSPKTVCEKLKNDGFVYGCAGPFRIDGPINEQYLVSICDYI
jgi:hypothetical protein